MLLPFAIIFISLALILYTVGVFAEQISGMLKKWHLAVFWLGLTCDTTGTALMSKRSGKSLTVSFHSVTGLAAIILMAVHAIWATIVMVRGSEKSRRNFHKFSIFVWLVWLIPYISGLFFGVIRHK
ncbi:MAG: HsmA family protein [Clostridiaceae bacterium]|nr:HsmA family protein [Clostridiaceae bacterium]